MEIERKFLISEFPAGMEPYETAQVEQGYLSMEPEVRIRHKSSSEGDVYKLCIKGEGTLAREEVEVDITQEQFDTLRNMLARAMVQKEYRVYWLPGELSLECSAVTAQGYERFMYAEVEFETEQAAKAFMPPPYLGEEVTEKANMRMKYFYFGLA